MTSDSAIDSRIQVLLIDDDAHLRQALSQTLDLAGLKVISLGDAQGLAARIPAGWPGVVVSDIRMPGIDGLQLLQQLRERDAELPVLLITGHGDVPLAVQAMRAGAYDFLEKPFANDDLLDSVRRALELRRLVLDNRSLRMALNDRQQLSSRLVGQSPAMQRLREQIGALASIATDVLILGETGAGKEVVARALHDLSNRREGPFVAINAGALAESVVESELFGHEAGAFTGAQKRRIGKFEFANGGTLFLDEIESMSMDVQVKLLRLLQERVVERLGGNQLIPLDIRVIAATKEDLRQAADAGRFRADLYYRLNVVPIHIPALRERPEEIQPLLDFYLAEFNQRYGRVLSWELEALDALTDYAWPGNIRELINLVERLVVTCSGERIELCDLPEEMRVARSDVDDLLPLRKQVENLERRLIRRALMQHKTTREAAKVLGLSQATLVQKMKRWEQG